MDVGQLEDGLWWWSCPHPEWRAGDTWDPQVVCTYVETTSATVVIDALVPADGADRERFLTALDRDVERRGLPFAALTTCGWHARSAHELVDRYSGALWMPHGDDARAHGAHSLTDGCAPVDGIIARDLGSPAQEFVFVLTGYDALVVGDLMVGGGDAPAMVPAGGYRDDAHVIAWYRGEARRRLADVVPAATRTVICGHGPPVVCGDGWPGVAPWTLTAAAGDASPGTP